MTSLEERKKKILQFTGPVCATITPYKADGSVDPDAIGPYVKYLVNNGVRGVYVHGTTGEGVSLSHEEKTKLTKEWVRVVREVASDLLLVINVSSCCILEAQDHARLCNQLQVDAIASLPPFYYKPGDVSTLAQYLRQIWTASPEIPMFYYHFPEVTGVNLPLYDFLTEGLKTVPSLTALKYTNEDIVDLNYLHCNFQGKVKLFPGFEESLLAAFALGLNTSICAQFNFKEDVEAFQTISSNLHSNPSGARKAQAEMAKRARKYQDGNFINNLKCELSTRVNFSVGPPRFLKFSVKK